MIFKDDIIVRGNWDLTSIKKFPKVDYLAADTETKLYYDGKQITDEKAYQLYHTYGQTWIKENLEVRAYAYMLADDENFALFQNIEDFLTACAMFRVKTIFWYNAKFDFALFDYYILSNGWTDCTEQIEKLNGRYGKLPDKSFQSLNGDFGQRYKMVLWKSYFNCNYQEKVHKFSMIDICNIYGGGLAKNLEDWKIKDNKGNDVRKLEMQYDKADIYNEEDLQYMINDTKGLYLLAMRINEEIEKLSTFSLLKGDYITAGGLAKKSLLKFMFKNKSPKKNIDLFKASFPITLDEDRNFRDNQLYLGGKCLVNPYKKGVVQHNVFKYDVNSMYPDKMRNMEYPFGRPKHLDKLSKKENKVYILRINNLKGVVRKNYIAVWQDYLTGDFTEVINEPEERYIWLEELEELDRWYILSYNIIEVLEYDARRPKGVIEYVDNYYKIKCTSKGAVKQGAKLFLNSAYGKLAQRIERRNCHYELTDKGYVHLVVTSVTYDTKSMLSVVVGSRITALSRVALMKYIREICKENPKEYFIYCDTDSVHALLEYNDTDNVALGKMKNEGVYKNALYLAPKSYLMQDFDNKYEVHCKGVNTKVVQNEIEKCKNFNEAIEVFRPNRLFKCLQGLNVKGGKALIYVDKMILNDANFKIVNDLQGDLEDVGDNY